MISDGKYFYILPCLRGYSIHTILLSMYLEKILLHFQLSNQKRIFFIFFSKCSSQKETSYLFENSI